MQFLKIASAAVAVEASLFEAKLNWGPKTPILRKSLPNPSTRILLIPIIRISILRIRERCLRVMRVELLRSSPPTIHSIPRIRISIPMIRERCLPVLIENSEERRGETSNIVWSVTTHTLTSTCPWKQGAVRNLQKQHRSIVGIAKTTRAHASVAAIAGNAQANTRTSTRMKNVKLLPLQRLPLLRRLRPQQLRRNQWGVIMMILWENMRVYVPSNNWKTGDITVLLSRVTAHAENSSTKTVRGLPQ